MLFGDGVGDDFVHFPDRQTEQGPFLLRLIGRVQVRPIGDALCVAHSTVMAIGQRRYDRPFASTLYLFYEAGEDDFFFAVFEG